MVCFIIANKKGIKWSIKLQTRLKNSVLFPSHDLISNSVDAEILIRHTEGCKSCYFKLLYQKYSPTTIT